MRLIEVPARVMALAALFLLAPCAALAASATTAEPVKLRNVPPESYVEFCDGVELAIKGQWADAEAAFRAALKRDTESALVRAALARVLRMQKRNAEALDLLEQAAKLAPDDSRILWELGYQYTAADRIPKASEYFEKAVALDPENFAMRQQLADFYLRQRDRTNAIRHWQEALKTKRASSNASLSAFLIERIAANYEVLGKIDQAIKWYRKALPIAPDAPELHRKVARLLAAQGKTNEAEEEFLKGVEQEPGYLPLRYDLAKLYLDSEDREKAYAQFKLYTANAPDGWDKARALIILTRLAGKTGRAEQAPAFRKEAIQILTKLVSRRPSLLFYKQLGSLLAEDGQYGQAAGYLQKAAEVARGQEAFQLRLAVAETLEKGQRHDDAEAAFRRLVADSNSSVPALLALDQYLRRRDRTQEAIDVLSKAVEQTPDARVAQVYYALASDYDALGRADEAVAALRKAVDVAQPDELPRLRRAIAQTLDKAGQLEAAEAEYRQLVADSPTDQRAVFLLASFLRRQDRFDEAVAVLEKGIEAAGKNAAPLYYALANYYDAQGRYDDAVATLKKALPSAGPGLTLSMRHDIARLLGKADKPKEAEDAYRGIVADFPTNETPLLWLADFLKRQERTDDALAVLKAGIEIVGKDKAIPLHLALFEDYSSRKEYDKAQACLQSAAAIDPQDPRVCRAQGQALQDAGKFDEAEAVYRKLVADFPDNESFVRLLAGFLKERGRPDEAIKVLHDGLAVVRKDGSILMHILLAEYYTAQDKRDQAETQLKTALQTAPDNPLVNNYLGYLYAQWNVNLQESVRLVKRALAARPNDGAILDSLAWAYYKLGRFQDALAEMKRSIAVYKDEPGIVVRDHYGDILWALGKTDDAKAQWKEVLAALEEGQKPSEPIDVDALKLKIRNGPAQVPKAAGDPAEATGIR